MTRRRWTITTHATGRPRDVDVYLYDKVSHMRAAATRHSKLWETDFAPFGDAVAVTHGFQHIRVNGDGSEEEQPLAAILRFSRDKLTPEIVAHEVTHAAQHLYVLDCVGEHDLAADHYSAANETFAYLLGDLFETVDGLLAEHP